jgi:hypothetical protein
MKIGSLSTYKKTQNPENKIHDRIVTLENDISGATETVAWSKILKGLWPLRKQ